jgi:hypothetical protein
MHLALYIPKLVSRSCPIPLGSGSPATALQAFSPQGLFNNTLPLSIPVPVRVPVPVPLLVPLPVPIWYPMLWCLPLPLPVFSCISFLPAIFRSLPFPSYFSVPCVSSSPLLSSLSLPSPGRLLPPLCAPGSALFSSSSSLSITSSQFSGTTARKLHGLSAGRLAAQSLS